MKFLFLLIMVVSFCTNAVAQDINFSQFYELPLLRNPALAGFYEGDVRATAAYRNQWNSVTVPYVTQALGVELRLTRNENAGAQVSVGLQLTNDVAGDSKLGKTQVLPVLAIHKRIDELSNTYISLGFMGGPVQQRFDPTKLSFDDQFVNGAYSATNPTQQTFTNTNKTYYDASVGLVLSSTLANDVKYYLGAALYHVHKPKVAFATNSDIQLNRKITFNAGLSAPFSDYNTLTLYADYFRQGGNSQAQGGFMYKHDLVQMDDQEAISLSLGSFLRWNDAVIPMIKLDYYELGIGITYDANISKLKSASQSRGSYEVTLTYRNFLNNRRGIPCPGF